MEKDIDVYEFDWWLALTGHIILFVISISSLYVWFWLNDFVQERFSYKLYILFLPVVFFVYLFPSLIELFSTPKLIYFKENKVVVIGPLNKKREFAYEDISSLQLYHKYSYPRFIKGKLYFTNSHIKIVFNPDRLPDLSAILRTIRNKGLGRIIEQK